MNVTFQRYPYHSKCHEINTHTLLSLLQDTTFLDILTIPIWVKVAFQLIIISYPCLDSFVLEYVTGQNTTRKTAWREYDKISGRDHMLADGSRGHLG